MQAAHLTPHSASSTHHAKGKELKGKKAYVFAVVDRIARGATPATIEA
jgi:hypothetical protein